MSYVADDKYFTPNLRAADSLKEIVMEQDALLAEMEAAWDQVRAEGRAVGRAIERRLILMERAAPLLTESALSRCTAALEQMDLEALPTVAEVDRVSSRGGYLIPHICQRILPGRVVIYLVAAEF